MPEPLESDTLYVSLRFGIVSHLCCCGCGNEVVTPISRKGWQLIYDGESISLYPSVGNAGLACQSHYWINGSVVEWAEPLGRAGARVSPGWWRRLWPGGR
jgi:hypothetical protein